MFRTYLRFDSMLELGRLLDAVPRAESSIVVVAFVAGARISWVPDGWMWSGDWTPGESDTWVRTATRVMTSEEAARLLAAVANGEAVDPEREALLRRGLAEGWVQVS